jgi:uncharacterized protein (TIGR00251 family)
VPVPVQVPPPKEPASGAVSAPDAASHSAGTYPAVHSDGGRLLVPLRVAPRASHESLALEAGELRVRLTAPPVEGAANEALLALLADRLRLPRRAVAIVRGVASRRKVVSVTGLDAGEFWRRLGL